MKHNRVKMWIKHTLYRMSKVDKHVNVDVHVLVRQKLLPMIGATSGGGSSWHVPIPVTNGCQDSTHVTFARPTLALVIFNP